MRRKLAWFALVALLVAVGAVPASAQFALPPGSTQIAITINGEARNFPTPPIMMNGQVMVPMRDVFEALNATVVWHGATGAVMAHNSDLVSVQIGSPNALVGRRPVTLAVAPILYEGRTYVPLQFVHDALGAEVAYDATSRTITIASAAPAVAALPAPQQFAEAPPVTVAPAQPMVPPAVQQPVCAPGPVVVHPQIPITVQPCPTVYPVPCVRPCLSPCPPPCPVTCLPPAPPPCRVTCLPPAPPPCRVACLAPPQGPITE